jgi:hypothetical protein
VTPSDFVVLKLDVESAGPVVLDRWFGAKGTRSDGCADFIDVLAFEEMGEGNDAGYVTYVKVHGPELGIQFLGWT